MKEGDGHIAVAAEKSTSRFHRQAKQNDEKRKCSKDFSHLDDLQDRHQRLFVKGGITLSSSRRCRMAVVNSAPGALSLTMNDPTSRRDEMHRYDFKRWRRSLGLSQKEAADTLGLKRRIVQYYEKGERDGEAVSVPKTVRLACYALSQGVDEFFRSDDIKIGKRESELG